MTDEEILSLVSHPGSKESGFRQLVMKYQQKLYQVIRRQVTSHEDADDVMQETFIKVFRHLHRFEGRSELYTWMYRIAIHEVINHNKRSRKEEMTEINNETNLKAEAYMQSDDLAQTLEQMVKQLPERQATVFRMRYYDELSYKQISDLLNITEGALKASFHHAVKKIEAELRARQIL